DEPSEEPSDEPTDPESPEPTSPGGLDTDEPSDEPPEETNGEFPEGAQRDENAPSFTEHPAAMGSESLSFEGLSGISFVSVPTAAGGSVARRKIQADELESSGFSLAVRAPDEAHGLVTGRDRMTLKGAVAVYVGSLTATTKDGGSLTLGPEPPPPMDGVEPGLLRVTM